MSCPRCDQLARELREAREELEEWRRLGGREDAAEADLTRLHALQAWLRDPYLPRSVSRPQAARLLQALVARAPEFCSPDRLAHVCGVGFDANAKSILRVNVTNVRKSLEALGLPVEIENSHGHGWRISREHAALVKAAAAAVGVRL